MLGAFRLLQQSGQVSRPDFLDWQGVPEEPGELPQLLDAIGVRVLMYPVDQGKVLGQAEARHSFVGEDHQVLDDPVRLQAFPRPDFDRLPFLIEDDLGLWNGEVHGSSTPSRKS